MRSIVRKKPTAIHNHEGGKPFTRKQAAKSLSFTRNQIRLNKRSGGRSDLLAYNNSMSRLKRDNIKRARTESKARKVKLPN